MDVRQHHVDAALAQSPALAGNAAFAADLHHALARRSGNLVFSPSSIAATLAMTYEGARGETATQLATALRVDSMNALRHAAPALGQSGHTEATLEPQISNTLWVQSGAAVLPAFRAALADDYAATVQEADFAGAPEAARVMINERVRDATAGKLVDLLPANSIGADTNLVVANAIYFRGTWKRPFSARATAQRLFHKEDGRAIKCATMSQVGSLGYAEVGGFQAVEFPYAGDKTSLIVLLPPTTSLHAAEAAVTARLLDDVMANLRTQQVHVTLPKFTATASFGLKAALSDLGVRHAFHAQDADFSGINGGRDLFVSDIVHKTLISVDEAGTEAAAATGAMASVTSLPEADIAIDRPFLFVIRDLTSDDVLFMGQVDDPGL